MIPIIYYLVTRDSSLSTSIVASVSILLVGLAIVYLIVENRIKQERRARLRQVENSVLEEVSTRSIALVRVIGIYAAHPELDVKLLEDNKEMVKKTDAFAKSVLKEGLQLPQSSLNRDSAVRFIQTLDDLLKQLYSVQVNNTFVFHEYPDVANVLSSLRNKESKVKSAFYWAFLDKQTAANNFQQQLEEKLTEFITVCDELGEITSRHYETTLK
jgi:hypothetical protein